MSSELRRRWENAGGIIPSDWPVVAFESLFRDGKSIAVGVMYPGPDTVGGTPLIKVGDIKAGGIVDTPAYCISPKTNEEHARTELLGDELLITLVGNPGECVIVKPHMAGWNPVRAIAVVRLKDPNLRTYLKTVLESSAGKHVIDSVLNTTVQRTLNLKDVRQLPIPMPPSGAIRDISAVADALADRIALLRETNATLEAIAQALFKSWFVDFDPVRAKQEGREVDGMDAETAELFPDSFEESQLGLVPKGWSVGTIDQATSMIIDYRGKTPKKLGREWSRSGIPAVSAKNIKRGRLVEKQAMNFVDSELFDLWMKDKLALGDVLMTSEAPLGELLYLAEDHNFCLSQRIFAMRANPMNCLSSFLYYSLTSSGVQERLSARATGTTVIGIRQSELRKVEMLFPPLSIQKRANDIFSSCLLKIERNEAMNETLTTLRNTLLPRLISGQLRLPEAIDQVKRAA